MLGRWHPSYELFSETPEGFLPLLSPFQLTAIEATCVTEMTMGRAYRSAMHLHPSDDLTDPHACDRARTVNNQATYVPKVRRGSSAPFPFC